MMLRVVNTQSIVDAGLAELYRAPVATVLQWAIILMATEGVTLRFGEDAITDIAASVNSRMENIRARQLQTIMERVLDDVSFSATDRPGETVAVTGDYVRSRVADLAKNADLSRFIL